MSNQTLSPYNGTISFNNSVHDLSVVVPNQSAPTNLCPVSNPAYKYETINGLGTCLCASGYAGNVTLKSGVMSGCAICQPGTWSQKGQKVCTTCPFGTTTAISGAVSQSFCYQIPCSSYGYIGPSGNCSCDYANGYGGTVTYYNGQLGGCNQITCNSTGYNGSPGYCSCDVGYFGTGNYGPAFTPVIYSPKGLTGCAPIPCTSPGYTGAPGKCVCATGYLGSVSYPSDGTLAGCYPIPCSSYGYIGPDGNCSCNYAIGYGGTVTYTNGVLGGCNQIPCTSTGYIGSPGYCSCDLGYYGPGPVFGPMQSPVVYNKDGTLSGCVGVPCTPTGYTGDPGKCVCATGYLGSVLYTFTASTGKFTTLIGCQIQPKVTFYDSYPPKSTGKSVTFNIDQKTWNNFYIISTGNAGNKNYFSDVTKSCWYGQQNSINFIPQSLSLVGCSVPYYNATSGINVWANFMNQATCGASGYTYGKLVPDVNNIYQITNVSNIPLFKTTDYPNGYLAPEYAQFYFRMDPNVLDFPT